MSQQVDWTPDRIEREIFELSNRIAKGVVVVNDLYVAFLEADREYDYEFARAYMNTDGPAHEKKYSATVATKGERERRDVADAAYRLAKDRATALQDQLRAMQSIGASVRAMFGVAGRGEY